MAATFMKKAATLTTASRADMALVNEVALLLATRTQEEQEACLFGLIPSCWCRSYWLVAIRFLGQELVNKMRVLALTGGAPGTQRRLLIRL
eukprot:4274246-Karenia_brevis.AAC.1